MTDSSRKENNRRISDLSVRDARRAALTVTLFVIVLSMFLFMIHEMLVAGILGVVIGAYFRPVQVWIAKRIKIQSVSAILTLCLGVVPGIALLVYGYTETREAAEYLADHTSELAVQVNNALGRVPFMEKLDATKVIEKSLSDFADLATKVPEGIEEMAARFAVATSIFLFTAFYILTKAESIVAYIRERVPPRYGPFAERLEAHIQGVLYGAVYGMLITQTMKALLVLGLNFLFGVPLPVVLALIAFIIGFFPVVGAWTVYVPTAGYLLIFQNSPWEASAMLVLGFGVSTVLLSMVVRPKLAAHESKVLNFYWMFVALVSGVYTFGVAGVVIGPIVVGVLKALFDTITVDPDRLAAQDNEKGTVFGKGKAEEKP